MDTLRFRHPAYRMADGLDEVVTTLREAAGTVDRLLARLGEERFTTVPVLRERIVAIVDELRETQMGLYEAGDEYTFGKRAADYDEQD